MDIKHVSIAFYHKGKTVNATVELVIDTHPIAQALGPKAYRNKSGRSKLAVGVIANIIKAETRE